MLSATHKVMENNEELQNLEIQALKSIYLDEFFDNIPPKAWKVNYTFTLPYTFTIV